VRFPRPPIARAPPSGPAMVFPIGDDNSGRHLSPLMTIALIVANVLVFVVQQMQPDLETVFMRWSVVPLEYTTRTDLPPEIPLPFWSTEFTSMFMHGDILHLGGNMLYLWIFGDNVEDAMGRVRYLLFYLVCGVGAAAAMILTAPDSQIPGLGASGAISGVLAAYLVLYPRQRVRVFLLRTIVYLPALVVIGFWILFQVVSGFGQVAAPEQTGGVAYTAHIGGFAAGFLLVWFFRQRRVRRPA
jgi:membrane associated rhomboid family serine protease